MPHTDRLWTA
ncbi:hypothetical protein WJX82_010335 [Trebouxia sp. C0006]